MPTLRPIFIFSLPRAGSTLLQRILNRSPEIETTSEPWVLIPLIYSIKAEGVIAEYSHEIMTRAIKDFVKKLPGNEKGYLKRIKELALALYADASKKKSIYFLDKTPRYSLIVNEIMELFPEGKFIFLWRNPLAICSSIIQTFGREKWCLYRYKYDLFEGMGNLIEAFKNNPENSISLNYENLLRNPQNEIQKVMEYLELPFEDSMIGDLKNSRINGEMGDPTGQIHYDEISTAPLSKWKETLNNYIRKRWATKYLKWIGQERLSMMGYDFSSLSVQIEETPASIRLLFSDTWRIIARGMYMNLKRPFIKWARYFESRL